MVTGLRGSALLTGYRGQPAVDVDGLVQVLHRVSRLVEDMPEVAELDCNPVIVTREASSWWTPVCGSTPMRPARWWRTPATCANTAVTRPPWAGQRLGLGSRAPAATAWPRLMPPSLAGTPRMQEHPEASPLQTFCCPFGSAGHSGTRRPTRQPW